MFTKFVYASNFNDDITMLISCKSGFIFIDPHHLPSAKHYSHWLSSSFAKKKG